MLEVIEMLGPGEYIADETQGITHVEDLPRPKLIRRSRNYKRRPLPLRPICTGETFAPTPRSLLLTCFVTYKTD